MANRPQFPGWLPQQHPAPAQPAGVYGQEFRPGMPFLQNSPRGGNFHQFPPRGPGSAPPGPPGHVVYRNVYPPGGGSPGFNNNFHQGWSGYPRGYVASPRATSSNVMSSQLQSFVPGLGYGAQGNGAPVGLPNQAQGQQVVQAQQGLHVPTYDGRGGSVAAGMPLSSDLRSNAAVKPLFLNWIDESVKDSASLQVLGDRGSSLKASSDNSAVVRSSDLYRLVDQVEDTIGKILALTDLESLTSGTEWSVCPFNPHHVVPGEAFFRHTLQCRSSLGGTVEASLFLNCLQYPHTVQLDSTEPFTHDERVIDRHPGSETSSNNATLSLENAALLTVNHIPIKRLDFETLKQEPGYVDTINSLEIPLLNAQVGTTDWGEKPECTTLTLSAARQHFDPKGSLFYYGEAPGVVVTSMAHDSSKGCGDAMSSMPHFLRIELEKCPSVTFESISNGETGNRRIVLPFRKIENIGGETRHTEVEERDQESHGVMEAPISVKRNDMTEREAEGSLTRIQHVGGREETACVGVLPSMLWSLRKELEKWKDMPSRCSRTVLQAATCLGRVRNASIVQWLLAHSPAYGVVLDVAMAAHISCLVQLYLKALRTQSLLLFDQSFASGSKTRDTSISVETMLLECPIYAEASTWLASWLSHLYGPINSKAVVLDILKHSLSFSGKFLSVVPLDFHSQLGGFIIGGKTEDVKGASGEETNVSTEHNKILSKPADNALEDILGIKEVGAAMDAVYERANFERYIKSLMTINNAQKPQR